MSHVSGSGSFISLNNPELPLRPFWTTNGVLSTESVSPLKAVEAVMEVWNWWADRVEDVFRQMNRQSDCFDLSVEDYIGWISRFSNHPPRPTMSPAEEVRDRFMGVPCVFLMRAHSRWEDFADELAETYKIMARELSRCKLRPGDAHELIDGDVWILDFSNMSLSADTSTITQVKAVFSAMLGPGRSFHRASRNSEHRQMPILSNNTWHVDEQVEERLGIEQPDGQSGLYPGEGTRKQWANEFLETLREINREMEDEEYRDLNLQGLNIEDQDMEG